jgi:hypothetical protein
VVNRRRPWFAVNPGMRFQRENSFVADGPAAVPPSTMAKAFGLKVRIIGPAAHRASLLVAFCLRADGCSQPDLVQLRGEDVDERERNEVGRRGDGKHGHVATSALENFTHNQGD